MTTPVNILEARGLVKRYGHVTALGGSDFDLRPGEILAVIGDNGAGKSSLIKCLSGAVVLGGTSLFGGRGLVIGTLVGALIVGVFRNGLQLMGVPSIYQTLITGILVILAVTVDQLSRRRTR